MQLQGKAYRVCIYIGEGDRHRGQPLYMALVEFLRKEGASGATVLRGLAGFGAHSRIHTATVLALSADLPIVVEWIDAVEQVERLLPQIRRMVNDGLITLEEIQVVQYAGGRRSDPLEQPVGDLMRNATTVDAETPLEQVFNLLLDRGYRSLPVVDEERRLVGIITAGDLLERAGLQARLGLQGALTGEQLRAQLLALQRSGLCARDIMTHPVITVEASDKVRTAVARMREFGLKRLPVVNEERRVVGMLSRIDVLRAIEYHGSGQEGETFAPLRGHSVTELMVRDTPVVAPDARLEQIIEALEASQRRRAIVVDDKRRVLGIITDGDLLRRSRHRRHPGLLARLRNLLGAEETPPPLPDADETAADLMTTPAITIRAETPLTEALALMVEHKVKRLPVVDEEGRLLGLLGRASLLHALLESSTPDG